MMSHWFENRFGHGDLAASQVFDAEDRRVLVDHHRRAVAVAEVDDLERHPLLAERHRQRGEDERRLEVVRQERLLQLGPAAEADPARRSRRRVICSLMKFVTGQVRWQVTGMKPTRNGGRVPEPWPALRGRTTPGSSPRGGG